MNVKAGDEMYLYKWVYIGFSEMYHWEKVVIARTTKTLIFVNNLKFRKSDIGIHLFEINDETIRKATKDNNFFMQNKLQSRFRNYKWKDVDLKTLMDIDKILLLTEKHNEGK